MLPPILFFIYMYLVRTKDIHIGICMGVQMLFSAMNTGRALTTVPSDLLACWGCPRLVLKLSETSAVFLVLCPWLGHTAWIDLSKTSPNYCAILFE